MFKKRLITALLGLPVIIAVLWFGEPWFTIVIALWGMLAIYEFYHMVSKPNVSPLLYLGLVFTLLFIISRNPDIIAFITPHINLSLVIPLLVTLAIIVTATWLIIRHRKEGALNSWAWTIAGIFYIGWLLGYTVALRGLEDGRSWTFFAMFVTFGSDTFAYFTGKLIGRHRMAPNISPRKTWEGAAGGVIGAIGISLLFLLPHPVSLSSYLSWGGAILIGFLVSFAAQIGDLVESLFKRNMEVKDSGTIMPGHGGILDRMDSILFSIVLVYYYAVFTGVS